MTYKTYLSIFVFIVIATFYCCVLMQKIMDWQLALGMLILVLADLTILLVYTVVEGTQRNLIATRVPNMEKLRNVDGVG